MLFSLIRIVLWVIVSVILCFIVKRSNIVRKKLASILGVILCMIIISISGVFPIENSFINFQTPESVFNYTNTGEIIDIVYGNESCMSIFSKENNNGGYYFIPKSENTYKIPNYYYNRKIIHNFNSRGSFDIFNPKNTKDYYIYGVTVTNEDNIDIVDSDNKIVNNLVIDNGNSSTKTIILYGLIENYTNDYYITINGEKISLIDN